MKTTQRTGIALITLLARSGLAFALGITLHDVRAADQGRAKKDSKASAPVMFADFESGRCETVEQTPWSDFTDSSLKGKSSIQIQLSDKGAENSRGAMALTGKLTSDFQWGGFAGARAAVQSSEQSRDLGRFTGVQFYARGDGRTYRVVLARDSIKDGNHFVAEFTAGQDWKLVQVPFTKLAQSPYFGTLVPWSASDVKGVGFMAAASPGEATDFKVELDNIAFYTDIASTGK